MSISLDSIKLSKKSAKRILVYGVQGIGKTQLARLLDNSLFLCTEKGFGDFENQPYIEINSVQDILEAIALLYTEDTGFEHLVIDTVSAMESIIHEKMLTDWNVESLDKVGVNGGGWYKWRLEALPIWSEIVQGLEALREKKGINIILLGHSASKEERPPDKDPYNKYTLDLLNKEVAGLLYRWVDVIAFYNYETSFKTIGAGKTKKMQAIGTPKRVIYLAERATAFAKCRYEGVSDKLEIDAVCTEFFRAFGLKSI